MKNSILTDFEAKEHSDLPDLKLNIYGCEYDISFKITFKWISVKMKIESFDYLFVKDLDKNNVEKKIKSYGEDKLSAMCSANKNAIWLAAVSGDHKEFERLCHEKEVKALLNETYNNKKIIQAMFDANPQRDLPFNDKKNYQKIISYLMDKIRIDFKSTIPKSTPKQTYFDLIKNYQINQNNLWFFQPYNPIHKELLSIFSEKFKELASVNVMENQKSWCLIL